MAALKVIISSTCYDLSVVRNKLRSFLVHLGYEPVMSDYCDVLYDPREHTHTSCLQEIENCDMVVLVAGSRFGGTAVPAALEKVDVDKLKAQSLVDWVARRPEKFSITQLEVLKAIQEGIPLFTFVDDRVWHDHLVYEKNKGTDFLDRMTFPSIEQQASAKYIFEFINFLRLRTVNNVAVPFSRIDDIETFLTRQWSALFQRLLAEQRAARQDRQRVNTLATSIEELKAAILSAIPQADKRQLARDVIRFRRVVDFVRSLSVVDWSVAMLTSTPTWSDLMARAGVVKVLVPKEERVGPRRIGLILLRTDDTYFECRYGLEGLAHLSHEWADFVALPSDTKRAIVDAWEETGIVFGSGPRRLRSQRFSDQFEPMHFEETSVGGLDKFELPIDEKIDSSGEQTELSE